jgi:hypothetical protein
VSRGSVLCVEPIAFTMESRHLPGFKPLAQPFREAGQDLGGFSPRCCLDA